MERKIVGGMVAAHVVMLSALFFGQAHAQEEKSKLVVITLVPVYAKAEQLVPVDLVYPSEEMGRHRDLEQTFFKNDWRPFLSLDSDSMSGSRGCMVIIFPGDYDVHCFSSAQAKEQAKEEVNKSLSEWHKRIQGAEAVVAVVKEFSQKAAARKVATRK